MPIKYPSSAIRRADKQIKELMLKIIQTKRGGTTKDGRKSTSRVLKEKTGKLQKNIKPIITVNKSTGELEIDIEVMEYYQYLDEGTKRIKHPWFLTDELMEQAEFQEAILELIESGFEQVMIDIKSTLEK